MSTPEPRSNREMHLLSLGALGIVFGDIGTSPLYTIKECLRHLHGADRNMEILGVLSLIFWSLILIVSLKYILFVSRANNQGEGGIFALLALLKKDAPATPSVKMSWSVVLLLMGTALLYGDGVITPAISVLSATEGIATINPSLHRFIIPLACVILMGLFWFQHKGTARIGSIFGPIMLVWFGTIGLLGFFQIIKNPEILKAMNPYYGWMLLKTNVLGISAILGAVVLSITGAEALYADMGHFGRTAISRAWHFIVLPSLCLNYFGQGAYAVANPTVGGNPFFNLAPPGILQISLLILSVGATVIASQALISGAFSLTRQAVQMGYFPRVRITHTSAAFQGQIYINSLNWVMAIGCIALVISFKSSEALAAAYGIAVTGTMAVTTIAFYWVIRHIWKWTLLQALPICGLFLAIDLAFFGSNLTKVFEGGWLPLVIAVILLAIMHTWKLGRAHISQLFQTQSVSMDDLMKDLKAKNILRVGGTAVFMASNPNGVPVTLLHHLKSNHCLHKTVVILSLMTENVPQIKDENRVQLTYIDENIWRAVGRFGYMESPDVVGIIEGLNGEALKITPMATTYYFNHETIITGGKTKMWAWEKELYAVMSRNASPARDYFRIPANRIVEMGLPIHL